MLNEDVLWVVLAGNPSTLPFRCTDKTNRLIGTIAGEAVEKDNIYFYKEETDAQA